jgi:hypothetical protein
MEAFGVYRRDEEHWLGRQSMHPNKHIREALKYAVERGWRIVMSKGHA